MPLLSSFESLERPGHKFESPLIITAGQVGYFEDKSIGGFVVARCLSVDLGGHVYIAHEEQIDAKGPVIIDLTPEQFAEHIPAGLSYSLEIYNEEDEYGTLIIRHVMPDGTVRSLN